MPVRLARSKSSSTRPGRGRHSRPRPPAPTADPRGCRRHRRFRRLCALRFLRVRPPQYASRVAYALAILSAAFYGAADFLGGLAARGMATVTVVVVSQGSGLAVLALLLPLLSESSATLRD